jgi:hypothetical protein
MQEPLQFFVLLFTIFLKGLFNVKDSNLVKKEEQCIVGKEGVLW